MCAYRFSRNLEMYCCKVCGHSSCSVKQYFSHTRIHSNLHSIPCGVPNCSRNLKSLNGFYSHVSRDHQAVRLKDKRSKLGDVGLKVKCTLAICQQELDFSGLMRHLNKHIRDGHPVKCPAAGCGRKMSKVSTMSAHLSTKHGRICSLNVDKTFMVSETDAVFVNEDDDNCVLDMIMSGSAEIDVDASNEQLNSHLFTRNAAMFLLKLQCQYFIPKSTVQFIVNELHSTHSLGLESLMHSLSIKLIVEGNDRSKVDSIISDLKRDDVFRNVFSTEHGTLRSEHRRIGYYKKNFSYVEPRQFEAGLNDKNKTCYYAYISIRETLSVMLEDASVFSCVKSRANHEPGVFENFCDGEVYNHMV